MATLADLEERKRELEERLAAGDVAAEAALARLDRAISARKQQIQYSRKRLDAVREAVDAGMDPDQARRKPARSKKKSRPGNRGSTADSEPVLTMVVIHRSVRAHETGERALVLLAMGIEHEIERGLFGWRLSVPEFAESSAREQLRLWEQENRRRGLPARPEGVQPGAAALVTAWCVVLMLAYTLQTRDAFGIDWTAIGRANVALMYAGAWWRTATALMLHSDIGHVVVNIGFGAVFGGILAREIGGGLAGLLILSGGIVGNLMNAVVQRPTHSSIGASTAVFAALGALSAWLWLGRRLDQTTWARRAAPLVAGIILLGWLGTGNERTDIVAHLTGFIAGFVPGAFLGLRVRTIRTTERREAVFGGLALTVICVAWLLALNQ